MPCRIYYDTPESPSSRRAWIEICNFVMHRLFSRVALLAEGVDRNLGSLGIEGVSKKVALLAEGVDRNFSRMNFVRLFSRRPPRGGRG